MTPLTTKVLIADDHSIVRTGLKKILDSQSHFEVVAEAATGEEAIKKTQEYRPHVVVMDIRMPGISGIEACRMIVDSVEGCKVIMLTAYADDDLLVAAIQAGAADFILKRIGNNELIHAINYVSHGDGLFNSSKITTAFNDNRQINETQNSHEFSGLTSREMKVLSLLPEGMTNRQIAIELKLSEGTIRNYVSHILEKISVPNRAGAAAFAVRHDVGSFVDMH